MQQNQSLEITKVALDAMGGDYAPGRACKGGCGCGKCEK